LEAEGVSKIILDRKYIKFNVSELQLRFQNEMGNLLKIEGKIEFDVVEHLPETPGLEEVPYGHAHAHPRCAPSGACGSG
jgi:hypothetical protein